MRNRTHRAIQHRSARPGIEAVTLVSDHAFPRHSHDQFGIGILDAGAQRSWSGIGPVEARAGDVITVNPGEIHDGIPVAGEVRHWRMLFFEPAGLAEDAAADGVTLECARPVLRDPLLARRVSQLFAQVTASSPDPLHLDEAAVLVLAHLLRRYGARAPAGAAATPAVTKARLYLDAAPEAAVTLADLATLTGLSRFQVLRGFAREVGATPHAYLVQRRVGLARRFLAAGHTPAEAALLAGFSDQSHMTRAFVNRLGVTPGRYLAALR